MYQVNGQTVLEEDYDENYQPTEEGPCLYVLYIKTFVANLLFNRSKFSGGAHREGEFTWYHERLQLLFSNNSATGAVLDCLEMLHVCKKLTEIYWCENVTAEHIRQ